MDIRSSLTDAYLSRFFDPGALARAPDCIVGVHALEIAQLTSGSLTATARVQGTAPSPYEVQLHMEVDDGSDWVFSSCSCPVGRLCKHGAALAMVVRDGRVLSGSSPDPVPLSPAVPPQAPGARQAPAASAWRQQLHRLAHEVTARSEAALTGMPLALELSRRRAHRWSRGTAGDYALRPMRPGARRGWVKSGAEWSDVAQPVAGSKFVPEQAEALRRLHRGLGGHHFYPRPGAVPLLDDFGDRLVPLLRDALAAGVELLAGEGVDEVVLATDPVTIEAHLTRTDDGLTMAVVATDGARHWRGDAVVPVGRPTTSLVLVDGAEVRLADVEGRVPEPVAELLLGPPVEAPAAEAEQFLDALAPLRRHVAVTSPDGSVDLPTPPRPRLLLTVTWRSATAADLAWSWVYGEWSCDLSSRDPLGGMRDRGAESTLLATLPPELLAARSAAGGDALALALHDLPHLRTLDDVEVAEVERPDFRETTAPPEITFTVATEQPDHTDWLDLEVAITVDGESIPLPDVLAAITRDDEFLVLPSGLYVALDRPELARLHEAVAAAAQLREGEGGRVSVGTHDLGVWAELAELGVVDAQAAAWVERARALRDLAELPQPTPVGITTTLRPYQLEGFWWLAFLHDHGLGGILADDMGLGKTLQVLALVQHAVSRGADRPFLVVAPTSVVTAWRHQAALHAPGLQVGVVTRRTDDVAAIAVDHDVVVTTYALLRLEKEQYAAQPWGGLVLDEAQQVKNHQGKTYAAVRALDADFRLVVTGTPFENRLMELWSLLSIATPGLYPWPRRFRDVVAGPVEKSGDQAALDRFRKRIRPFLLRRTKELVADELPPKQEQVLEVDLHPRHRKVYDSHLARERQRILGLVDDFDRNRVAIFSALTRLRQLALDPALVDPVHDLVGSAKVDLLADHLGEITAEGHRALVFSQFTSFLGRVRERLAAEGLATVYLDGRTRDRAEVVDAFRRGEAPVFLISLKAGGTGLTLTEADYVFVLDPWWNPAAEAQAVDRAHRIGQDKHVHVYRLVATDTIEEKVMELKARKAELFARVIDDGAASGEGITADDIRGLFDE